MDNTIQFDKFCNCKLCNAELTQNDLVYIDPKTKEDLGCIYCIDADTAINRFG